MNIIREENPSYFTILLRKSTKVKIIETIIFILLIIILSLFYNFSDSKFKIGAILLGVLVLFLSPVIYKIMIRPKYILTSTHLIIEKINNKREIPIVNIEQTYDLRFFYFINGKKTPLMISDNFIEDLNVQLDQLKRSKKKY